jgi:hypothetical protein
MWIFLNDAFLSIVTPRTHDVPKPLRGRDLLLVRARKRGDIQRVFPSVRVTRTPNRDYAFRAFVPRPRVIDAIGQRLLDMEYGNFKDSVANDERHSAYSKVWSVMYSYQHNDYQPRRDTYDRGYDLWPDEHYAGN